MARALGTAHANVPLIADDTLFLFRCDEDTASLPMVDAAGNAVGVSDINMVGVTPGLFWPSDDAGLYGARSFDGTQQQEFSLPSAQLAPLIADQLTLELWFELDSVTGTQRFVSVAGDRASELEADNFVLAVGTVGAELNVFWETGAGANISNTTSAAGLQTGRVYKLGVVRKPASNRNPAKCDVEVHIWDKLSGARYFELFTNVLLPTGGGNAWFAIGGEYDGATGANHLVGRLDDIRLVSYSASMEAMRNTFFRAVRPWYPDHLVGLSSVVVTQVPVAVTKFLRVRVEQPDFDEGPDPEWAASVSYTDATGEKFESFTLLPRTNASAFTLSSGTLPPGLSLDTDTGAISGTPTTTGTYTDIVIEAAGPGGTATSAPFRITVDDVSSIRVSYTSSTATLSSAFTLTPTTNGTSFVLISGSLPDGLSLDAGTGIISGTLSAAGLLGLDQSDIVVRATNTVGSVDSAPFTIAVQGVALPVPTFHVPFDADTGSGTVDGEGGLGAGLIGNAFIGSSAATFSRVIWDNHSSNGGPSPGALYGGSGVFTACAWIRPNVYDTAVGQILDRIDGENGTPTPAGWALSHRNGAVLVTVRTTGTVAQTGFSAAAVGLGEWGLVALEFDHGTVTVRGLIDGVEVVAATGTGVVRDDTYNSNFDLAIGANNNSSPTQDFDGDVDEVSFFEGAALTADQWATLVWLGRTDVALMDWIS